MQVADQTEKKANDIHYGMSAAATKAYSLFLDLQFALHDYRRDLDNHDKSLQCARIGLDLENHCKANPGIRSEIQAAKDKMWQLIQKTKNAPRQEDPELRREIEVIKKKIAAAEAESVKKPAAAGFFTVTGVICAIAALACFIINKIIEPNVIVGMLGAWSVVGVIGSCVFTHLANSPMRRAQERVSALKKMLADKEKESRNFSDERMKKALDFHSAYHALLLVLGGARAIDLDI